ncbi:MAG: hypothetical protein QM730_24645 [Anaerolineales bacterium]
MKFFKSILLINIALYLSACGAGATPYLQYQPPGIPVAVTIDLYGNVDVSWAGSVQTPLGSFEVGLNFDPSQNYPNANGTLTVRVDGKDVIYDLAGNEDINIHLDSGYYKQVNLQKSGKDWLFEVEKISDVSFNSSQNEPSSPPIFDHIDEHNNYSNGQLVINQDVYFSDPNGDATLIQYDMVSIVPDISGIHVEDDPLYASPDEQVAGTYKTIMWECGSSQKTYVVTLRARIFDQAGNQSDPFRVVFSCR